MNAEPIINPWWFYLIDALDVIKTALFIALLLAISMTALLLILYSVSKIDREVEESKELLKIIIKTVLVIPALLMLSAVCPSKVTIKKMIISQYITEGDVKVITEQGKETIDYIFEKIEGMNRDEY